MSRAVAESTSRFALARTLMAANRRYRTVIIPLVSLAVFLSTWQIVGAGINPILMATPTAVAGAFVELVVTGRLIPAFLVAVQVLVIGFLLATTVGVAVGIAMGRSDTIYRVLSPYVSFFNATPTIALLPLIVIWFGIDIGAEIAIVVIVTVDVIIINTTEGVRNTPANLLDMARIYHVGERATVWGVAIPHSLPYIFAGLRVAIARALVGIIVAEIFISLNGLGGLVARFGDSFRTAELIATIMTTSVAGVMGVGFIEWSRRRVAPWAYR